MSEYNVTAYLTSDPTISDVGLTISFDNKESAVNYAKLFGGTVREEKTMLEVFVERNPEAPLHPDKGIPNDICPYLMGYEKTPYCDDKEHCCCVDCWDREYKDVK